MANDFDTYGLLAEGVRRFLDEGIIPPAADNADWQAYQKWLAEGHFPRPLQPDGTYDWDGGAWVQNPARSAAAAAAAALGLDAATVKAIPGVITFLKMSPAEIDAYIDANVTGLNPSSFNSIKDILKLLAKVVSVTTRAQIAP